VTQPTPPLDDIRPDPEAEHFARASAPQPVTRLAPEIPKDEPDTLDIIRSAWHRENLFGASLNQFVIRDGSDTAAPDWNPYAYAVKNADAFGDVMGYVMKGHFDNIYSERDFLAKAEHLRKQQEDKEVLDAGGWRSVAAQMGVGLLDPTNLIPLGKGALKGSVYLGGATAATEGLLHQADPTRTLQESALAIASGTALGGAFGHWSRNWDTPDQRLHPDHPENPLRTQNLGDSEVIETKFGERLDSGTRINGASINAAVVDQDALAAALKADAEGSTLAKGTGLAGIVQRTTERIFDADWKVLGTPLSRHWAMPAYTRGTFQRIADLGGRLTSGMVRGEATVSAETLAAVERQHLATVLDDIKLTLREANVAVGQTLTETKFKDFGNKLRPLGDGDSNRIEEVWFTQAIRGRQVAKMLANNRLADGQKAATRKALTDDLSAKGFTPEQIALVEGHVNRARNAPPEYHQKPPQELAEKAQKFRDSLTAKGLTPEQVAEVERQVAGAKISPKGPPKFDGTGDLIEAHAKSVRDDLVAKGFSAEQAHAVERHITKAAKSVEDHLTRYGERAVRAGLMNPEDFKGAGYGLPVLYLRDAVNADPGGFRAVLAQQLIRKLPDSFLEAYAEKLGKSLDELKSEMAAKPGLHDEAMIAWRGDYEDAMRDAAIDNFESLSRVYEKHRADLDIQLYGKRIVDKARDHWSMATARAEVRKAEASYWERRIGLALARARKAEARVSELRRNYPDLEDLADDVQTTFAKSGDELDRVVTFLDGKLATKNAAKSEAHELSAALRADRAGPHGLDAAGHPDVLAARKAEVAEAIAARKQAVAEANGAMDELRQAARESRNANRWLDAVVRRIESSKADLAEELKAPGLEATLKGEADRIAKLKETAEAAADIRRTMFAEAKKMRDKLKLTRADGRAMLKDFNAAKRGLQRIERSTPMHELLDDMVEKIRGGKSVADDMPNGMLFDMNKDTGRLKERTIHWEPDLWKSLEDRGFVATDLYGMLNQHHREMSGRIALQQTLGTTDLTKVLKGVDAEFQELMTAARAKGDQKALDLLVKQREVAVEDITQVFNKVRGISRSGGEGDESIVWAADKLRGAVLVAAAGGFVFSAMADVAAGMLATSGFFRGLVKHAKGYRALVEKARAGDPEFQELRTLHASMEHALNIQTEHWMLGDVKAGFGSPSARGMREKLDTFQNRVAERTTALSGLTGFSNWVRRTAGLTQLSNIARDVRRYDQLDAATRANLASIGIGATEARGMAKLFEKYGKDVDGITTPGLAQWRNHPNGDHLADRLGQALVLTQRRASYVPGYASVPLMMNKWYGALLLQFQSYAYQFTHSFLLAGTQRLATVGETKFIGAMATLIAATTAISALRAFVRGEDPTEKDEAWWAGEVIQRSGLLGFTGPYVDATVKAFGPAANDFLGAPVFAASSKFRDRAPAQQLLGPAVNYLNQPIQVGQALAEGDAERAWRVTQNLIPLHQTAQAIGALHDWATDE